MLLGITSPSFTSTLNLRKYGEEFPPLSFMSSGCATPGGKSVEVGLGMLVPAGTSSRVGLEVMGSEDAWMPGSGDAGSERERPAKKAAMATMTTTAISIQRRGWRILPSLYAIPFIPLLYLYTP